MKTCQFAAVGLALALIGCDVPELESPQAAAPPQSSTVAQTNSGSGGTAVTEPGAPVPETPAERSRLEEAAHVDPASFLPDGRVDMRGVPDEPPMTTGVPREVDAKDPKKGKLTRKSGGALGASMKAIPWVENKTKFDMIKYNMAIFEADKSRWPKSHKEFMEVFLPQYYPVALPLPELEPGDEYIYDPDDHLLKIWRPAEATPEIRAKYLGETAAQPASAASAENLQTGAAPQSANPGSANPNEPPAVDGAPREVTALDPAKGKKSRAAGGYFGAIGGARFYAEHSMIFNNMKHSLDLFNASEGRYPNSHEEFMAAIIQANQIALPELDPGVEYLYDPEDHQLKVWRPEDPDTAPESLSEEE
jgi:hypothetical protein